MGGPRARATAVGTVLYLAWPYSGLKAGSAPHAGCMPIVPRYLSYRV